MSAGMVNTPFALVVTVALTPASPATLTVAPGITPPPESVTVPVIDDVVPPCANAGLTPRAATRSAADHCLNQNMLSPPSTGADADIDSAVGYRRRETMSVRSTWTSCGDSNLAAEIRAGGTIRRIR